VIGQLAHQGTQAQTMQPTTAAGRRPLQDAWHRIRLIIREMNYASRLAELHWQAQRDALGSGLYSRGPSGLLQQAAREGRGGCF
jgi:hypothetical protein